MEAARISRNKAMAYYEENKEEMNEGAKVLWPERLDLLSLMEKRATRRLAFNSEYQSEPIDSDTRTFKKIYYYKPDEIRMEDLDIFGAVDPSLGKTKRADNSVILTAGRHRKTGVIYILDVDNKRRGASQLMQDLFAKSLTYDYMAINIETIAFQQFFKDEVVKKSSEQGIYLPIKEFKSTIKKEVRIASALEPLFSTGQIRILETQRDLIEQLEYFPKGKADDCLDGCVMIVDLARNKSRGLTFGRL